MHSLTSVGRRLVAACRGRDVALVYAGIVVMVTLAIQLAPQTMADHFVVRSSTNLLNLRQHPMYVLFVSAFIVPSPVGLLLLVPLVCSYGVLQRWLGRAALIITVVLGHVGATLFVATMLAAGIAHRWVPLSEVVATDVGVSYGLVAVLGLLAIRVPRRWAAWYVVTLTAGFVAMILIDQTATDVGHTVGWIIGLGLAVLVGRAVSSQAMSSQAVNSQAVSRGADGATGRPEAAPVRSRD